jgi:hypothetical protein
MNSIELVSLKTNELVPNLKCLLTHDLSRGLLCAQNISNRFNDFKFGSCI